MAIPEDPEKLLRRAETAAALTASGYPTTTGGLETRASRGGGPPFRHWGSRTVLYRWGDALEWAQSRLGPAVRTTSELGAPEGR
jgi:hypothetical protein